MSRRGSPVVWAAASFAVLGGAAIAPLSSAAPAAAIGGREPSWLRWRTGDGAETCPDARSFADKVERRLGAPAQEAARRQAVTIAVEIRRHLAAPSRWQADMRVSRADGTPVGARSIEQENTSCGAVEDMVAFFVGLVLSGAPSPLDDEAGGPQTTPDASTGPPPGEVPLPAAAPLRSPEAVHRAAVSEPPPSAAPEARWVAAVEAGPIVASGLLPGLSFGALAALRLERSNRMQASLALGLWPGHESRVDAGTGANTSLITAGLGLCPLAARWTTRTVRGCVGAMAGRLSATGSGFDSSMAQSHLILDLSGGARLEQVIAGRFFAALEARAEVPLFRVGVSYADSTGQAVQIFRMKPVAAVGQLQLGCSFWP